MVSGVMSVVGLHTQTIKAEKDAAGEVVDWRATARDTLAHRFSLGKCRERILSPVGGRIPLFKFRIDEEENMGIMTSRDMSSGVTTSGLERFVRPLFAMNAMHHHAHVDFAKGFAVFQCYRDPTIWPDSEFNRNFALQIYRTRKAISRSSHSYSSATELPYETDRNVVRGDPNWRAEIALNPQNRPDDMSKGEDPPLPRGVLAFYREIIPPAYPPSPSLPFRVRVDAEGTENERVVLGMATEQNIYLWDVEDEKKEVEVFEIPGAEFEISIQSIDFDDDYIFLTGLTQVHVSSRKTKQRVLVFPPEPATADRVCSVVYSTNLDSNDVKPVAPSTRTYNNDPIKPPTDTYVPAEIGRAVVQGRKVNDSSCNLRLPTNEEAEDLADGEIAQGMANATAPSYYEYTACHFTATDLICSTKFGQLFIVRDYASILGITNNADRAQQWANNTIIIDLNSPILNLAVNSNGHIVGNTTRNVFFFNTDNLPSLDPITTSVPPIWINSIFGLDPVHVAHSPCLQIGNQSVWLAYRVAGEGETGPTPVEQPAPYDPMALMGGPGTHGYCIKEWDFGLDE